MDELIVSTVQLSLKVAICSVLFMLPVAIFSAWLLANRSFYGKTIFEGIINLPLVMPPVTTGYILLIVLGKNGIFGSVLFEQFGITIAFTTLAAVISSAVVSFPLVVRSARIGFEYVDSDLEQAAITLGSSPLKTFFTITLPLALPGIISGTILGFARSLGEFGATITFAGNIQGISRTLPLSIYSYLQIPGKENTALLLVVISIAISFLAMIISSIVNKHLVSR